MAKALQDNFGVVEGLMTTIHAYTGDKTPWTLPHPKVTCVVLAQRCNIVPNTAGAAKAIGK